MAIAATTEVAAVALMSNKLGVKKEMSRLWMKEDSFRRTVNFVGAPLFIYHGTWYGIM